MASPLNHEWLAFLDENSDPFLFNPFSTTRIRLPAKHTLPTSSSYSVFHSSHIDKLFLCGNPSHDSNYVVIVMYSSKLAFCRHGDQEWSNLETDQVETYDVICCDETKTVFALGPGPRVESWDFIQITRPPKKRILIDQDSCPSKLREADRSFPSDLYTSRWYLVMSGFRDIFLVVRYIGEFVRYDGEVVYEGDTLTDYAAEPLVCPYRTVALHVFKLDGDRREWTGVESWGNFAMFLGGNRTVMVSTKEYSCLGLKGNCIYFRDDYWDRIDEDYSYGGHDNGVFKIEDGTIETFLDPPPTWIN